MDGRRDSANDITTAALLLLRDGKAQREKNGMTRMGHAVSKHRVVH